jgi:hypothetical protein
VVVRVASFRGSAEALEHIVRVYEGEVVPWLEEARGFCGMLMLVEPGEGRGMALTFWSDADALDGAKGALDRFRTLVRGTVGSTNVGTEEYEVGVAAGITFRG